MAACSQNKEIIAKQFVTEGDFRNSDGQVVIQLDGGKLNASAFTTVTCTLITDANFIGTNVDVLVLAVDNGADITTTDRSTAAGAPLSNIQGVIATQANSPGSETDVKRISLYRGGTSRAAYYYSVDNKYDYTFYGCSPHQATGATVTTGQATTRFTFNGSQDIIWNRAAAPNILEQPIFINGSIDEKDNSVLTGYKAKYIRQLKYHHDLITIGGKNGDDYKWVPNINFTHLLTQFTFQMIATKKQSEVDREAAQKLKVKNVYVKGHDTSATLNVIGGTLTWAGSESLSMLLIGTDNVATGTFILSTAKNGGDKTGHLMAKPADGTAAFEPEVTIEAPDAATNVPIEQTVTLQVNTPGGFKQGVIYNAQTGAYSIQEVMVGATPTEQQGFDGGNVDVSIE